MKPNGKPKKNVSFFDQTSVTENIPSFPTNVTVINESRPTYEAIIDALKGIENFNVLPFLRHGGSDLYRLLDAQTIEDAESICNELHSQIKISLPSPNSLQDKLLQDIQIGKIATAMVEMLTILEERLSMTPATRRKFDG